jgi:5-methylthioadenosine/S-adenosylhomocysteine deaminase
MRSALPPLTETDDPDFRARIRANVNLPVYFRQHV